VQLRPYFAAPESFFVTPLLLQDRSGRSRQPAEAVCVYIAVKAVASGLYFYQLKTGNTVQTKAVMFIK
jgi:hypothetical protein